MSKHITYPEWLHYFDTIDSTNIYAMQQIDAGMAHDGNVIWALHQTQGRGQRGKVWNDESGKNIMMSLIIKNRLAYSQTALCSMLTANVVQQYFSRIYNKWQVAIKWPNDIYINDKKASGILIENIWKGMLWTHSVIGIGINVNQNYFPENLPNATSLFLESGIIYDLFEIIADLRTGLLNSFNDINKETTVQQYNNHLYKRNKEICFEEIKTGRRFEAFVQEVDSDGNLVLLTHKGIEKYTFGTLIWEL